MRPNPLAVVVRNAAGQLVQEVVFENDGTLSFALDDTRIGNGRGRSEAGEGPAVARPAGSVRSPRALDTMEPRWQSDMYGSRNPVAMLLGTGGWGLFVATPWVQVDLRQRDRGVFIPSKPTGKESGPQTSGTSNRRWGRGFHPSIR